MPLSTRFVSSIFILSAITSHYAFSAQNDAQKDLTLLNATLFLQGVELDNNVTLSLTPGQNKFILSNLANNIDPNTLSISMDNDDVVIRSLQLVKTAVSPVMPPELMELKSQLNKIQIEIDNINVRIQVGNEQVALLKDQGFFGGSNQLSLAQTEEKLDFVKQKMMQILIEQQKDQRIIDELTQKKKEIEQLIDNTAFEIVEQKNQIELILDAKHALNATAHISYLAPDASWQPVYDIRSKDTESLIVLTYKANVIQNTGMDWENVNLTLSSINPVRNITPPLINPWRLAVYDDSNNVYRERDMPAPVAPAMYEAKKEKRQVVSAGVASFVSVNNNGINLSYQISTPYSLKSSHKANTLTIKQDELVGKYQYMAIPKSSEQVYLQAQIDNFNQSNLLNGTANIYFANTYIGQHQINSNKLSETLKIPFGIDKSIHIKREINGKMKKNPTFIGSTVEQKEGYLITVKNVHEKPINLVIYDQIPISEDNSIKITDFNSEDAQLNTSTGIIKWDLNLIANQEMAIPFNYTIHYPKDKHIIGLK